MRGTFDTLCSSIFALGLTLIDQAAVAQNSTQKWQRLEADNGAAFAVDLNSISHNDDGSAVMITCVVDNDSCPPLNMSRFIFDCRGHYRDGDRGGALEIAPPRSVVGRMAEIACKGAKDTLAVQALRMNPPANQKEAAAIRKAFGECLLSEGKSAQYVVEGRPSEDDKSADGLLDRCRLQRYDWQRQCVAGGGTVGFCASRSSLMAFYALLILGK